MSLWKKIKASRTKRDPVRQVLSELLGTEDFTYDVLGILGLERRYEVLLSPGDTKLYLNVLAFGADCEGKVGVLEQRRKEDVATPAVLAWKSCEPRLNGNPYILSDKVI